MRLGQVRASLLAATLLGAAALPAVAAGTTYTYEGKSVWARFDSHSHCLDTTLTVFASRDQLGRRGGNRSSGPFVGATLVQYDTCKDRLVRNASGSTDNVDVLRVDDSLGTADLQATVKLDDRVKDRRVPLEIDLTWAQDRAKTTGTETLTSTSEGIDVTAEVDGTYRQADATGTVTQANSGTNLASGQSDEARIQDLDTATVTLGK